MIGTCNIVSLEKYVDRFTTFTGAFQSHFLELCGTIVKTQYYVDIVILGNIVVSHFFAQKLTMVAGSEQKCPHALLTPHVRHPGHT